MGKLGDTLRERRVALGLSLEQAQDGTRIRQRLLEALEEGNYDRLPNPGYVRGYISSYARFLELDPVPLLNMYKAETGSGRLHELNLPQAEEAVAPTGQQHAIPLQGAIAVVLVIALISLSIWAVARIWSGPPKTAPIPAPVTETTQTPDEGETPTEEVVEPAPKPAEKKRPFTMTLRVDAEGASWMKITVDGKPAYEGTLAGGQTKEFEVTKRATARIGKPEAVTVLRDGTEVKIETGGDIGIVDLRAKEAE